MQESIKPKKNPLRLNTRAHTFSRGCISYMEPFPSSL